MDHEEAQQEQVVLPQDGANDQQEPALEALPGFPAQWIVLRRVRNAVRLRYAPLRLTDFHAWKLFNLQEACSHANHDHWWEWCRGKQGRPWSAARERLRLTLQDQLAGTWTISESPSWVMRTMLLVPKTQRRVTR